MTLISTEAFLNTEQGFMKVKDIDFNKVKVNTSNGYRFINVIGKQTYEGNTKQLQLWGYLNKTILHPTNSVLGVAYKPCLDLGGPYAICGFWRRCWKFCPNNNPIKNNFLNPVFHSYFRLGKYSFVILPCLSEFRNYEPKFNLESDCYHEGFNFGLEPKEIDFERYFKSQYIDFFHFMQGWVDSMTTSKPDKWNYMVFTKSLKTAEHVQFLFNRFGVPCALEPYHSTFFKGEWYALFWSKNKKVFHYKSYIHNKTFYTQVKKLENISGTFNFLELESEGAIAAPFYIK